MQFVRRDVWQVTFLEPGLQRPLPKTLTFKDEGKIRELARRGEAWQISEDRQLLDYAITKGEGGGVLATIAGAVREAETGLTALFGSECWSKGRRFSSTQFRCVFKRLYETWGKFLSRFEFIFR